MRSSRIDIRHFPADHQRDELILVELGLFMSGDRLAVAQDRDAVGYVEDLFETMRDIDAGDALVA